MYSKPNVNIYVSLFFPYVLKIFIGYSALYKNATQMRRARTGSRTMQGDTPLGVTHIKKNNNKNINCEVNSKDMDGHSDVPIFRLGFISVLSS